MSDGEAVKRVGRGSAHQAWWRGKRRGLGGFLAVQAAALIAFQTPALSLERDITPAGQASHAQNDGGVQREQGAGQTPMIAGNGGAAESLPPQRVRYPECPPTDARGRPRIEFEFSGFRSQEHAEQATFVYLKCFASIEAIQEWLSEQGFDLIHVNEPAIQTGGEPSSKGKTVAASRPLGQYGAVWGGLFSRWWQQAVAYRISVELVFTRDGTLSELRLIHLIN